jgi:predicted dehydrogenase
MAMDKVQVVIIGYGSMGGLYADMIAAGRIPELGLFGICCRNQARHNEINSKFPGIRIYSSDIEVLSDYHSYDAVIVTTPHKTHVQLAATALSHGTHVLCEKPLGVSLKDAQALQNLATASGRHISMIFNWRTREVYRKAKELVSCGGLGTLTHVVWIANFWYRTAYYHRLSPWRSSWTGEGGGLAINQMQHVFDIGNWLFGVPQEVLASVAFGRFNDISVDDSFEVLFTYPDGLRGVCVASSGESPGSNHLEIHGSLGKLVLDGNELRLYRNEIASDDFSRTASVTTGIPYVVESSSFEDRGHAEYEDILRNFGRSVLFGEPPIAPLSAGVDALTVANAIYFSAWEGRPIKTSFDADEYQRLLDGHITCENRSGGIAKG